VQALVPFDRLVELERFPGVGVLRPPLAAVAPQGEAAAISSTLAALQGGIVGQEVAKTNADDWHAQGWTGAGVKVGIIDAFDGALWSAAQAAGEVPAPAGTFCRVNGASCDVFAGGSSHGEGVAEIVHEMAPGAQIYIAQAGTGHGIGPPGRGELLREPGRGHHHEVLHGRIRRTWGRDRADRVGDRQRGRAGDDVVQLGRQQRERVLARALAGREREQLARLVRRG
jgi:hypothetical protein